MQDAGVQGLQGLCDDLQAALGHVLRQNLTWNTAAKGAAALAVAGGVLRCGCLAVCFAGNSALGSYP